MPPEFFEGTEKKMELAVVSGHSSLRTLGAERWESIVAASGAQILSRIANERVEAYLLSESSLFVFDDRVTLITCGRTRLVEAAEALLSFISPEDVASLVYERKAEHFPEHQPTTFYEDARLLSTMLPGRAYRFGDEHDHHVHLYVTERPFAPPDTDTTLEVLMHGIDRERAESFRALEPPDEGTVAAATGLDRILDGFQLDENCFTPAGYSLNAIRGDTYYTVHVTPEELGSYVSFETNHDFRGELDGLIARVVHAFSPRSFDVLRFTPDQRPAVETPSGYLTKDVVEGRVGGYRVTYAHSYLPDHHGRPPVELDL